MPIISKLKHFARGLRNCESGAVVVEFAYVLPIFVTLSFTGIEVASLAISNMRVSQIAMTVADNMSRAKESVPLGLPQLREADISDTFLGARIQGGNNVPILQNGRIIVSSLQQNSAGRQTIKWQRCKGMLNVQSLYGVQGDTQPAPPATNGFQGMGVDSAGAKITAPNANTAIIFVEVTYTYVPTVAASLLGPRTIRKEAAFYVRDDRDLEGNATTAPDSVYNPSPAATVSACNVYNSTF